MARNYDKPLTIVLTGSGVSRKANTEALLEDFIFGNLPGDAQVDVKFIVPYASRIKPGLVDAIDVMKAWGIDGDDFIPVVEPDCGSNTINSAGKTTQIDQGDAMLIALQILNDAHNIGRDTAFISIFDPVSIADLSDVEYAKSFDWLSTLNLAEGLIDSFEGYESEADKVARKVLQEAFDEQQAAKVASEEATSPKPVKKATTPRKRAAKKAVTPVDVPLVDAPEKPLSGTRKLVAMAVEREAAKKTEQSIAKLDAADMIKHCNVDALNDEERAFLVSSGLYTLEALNAELAMCEASAKERAKVAQAVKEFDQRTELSGTIAMTSSLPVDLQPVADIQMDIAKAAPSVGDSVVVAKSDIAQLGDAMQKMAEGFSEALSVYKKIVETN